MAVDHTIPTQANTNLATFRIFSNGTELSDKVGVSSIMVSKSINKIPKARIVLFDGSIADRNFELSTGENFKPGNEIEVKGGYHTIEDTVFKGIIIKHSIEAKADEASKLVIDLRDISVKMTVGRKNRYFNSESPDSEIIEQIIGEYDELEKEVEATDIKHQEMVQHFTTDWDFILSRAEASGKLVFADDGKITVKAPSMDADPIINLSYGDNVFEFEAGMDARDQYSATTAKAWNFIKQKITEREGSEPILDKQGNISGSELAAVVGLDKWILQHPGRIPDKELQAWADAKLMRSRLAKIKGRVKIIGFSQIKPGDVIELEGFGDRFNGKAFVSSISHKFVSEEKWYTQIEFGLDQQWFTYKYDDILDKPASGLVPAIQGLHQGIVTNIHEDPDGESRVKVRIPVINTEAEGIWARIATLDAGLGDDDKPRGTFFRPEIGDEVVIGFFNEDPRDPVILGRLYSSTKPPPYDVTEDNFKKGIVTRGQLKVTFDDDLKSITIETPNQNKLIFNDDDGSILLEDENGNKIQMNSNGINIESAADITLKATGDFKAEGVNINQNAQSQFKAKGNSTAELSASGQTVVKGSIVQIN